MYSFGVIDGDLRMKYVCNHLINDGYCAEMYTEGTQYDVIIHPVKDGRLILKNRVLNYKDDNFFKKSNAYPTAEGALAIAISCCDKTLKEQNCVIIGSGNIASCLYDMLTRLEISVTMCARRNAPHTIDKLPDLQPDIIFNTVPARVLTNDMLKKMCGCKIIELASFPFCVDFEYAKKYQIAVIKAGGLPAKFSPDTAGRIIKETVIRMLGGKDNG